METVKKQADTIHGLESELSKARKQERAYEEAMEQLQTDLDVLEQENAKLKAAGVGHERQGIFDINYASVLVFLIAFSLTTIYRT